MTEEQNSVTKIYPHVGKKNYYYFCDLIWNEYSKSYPPNSKYLLLNIQTLDKIKNIKKFGVGGGIFW